VPLGAGLTEGPGAAHAKSSNCRVEVGDYRAYRRIEVLHEMSGYPTNQELSEFGSHCECGTNPRLFPGPLLRLLPSSCLSFPFLLAPQPTSTELFGFPRHYQ
jgi:hypothetical protein